MRNSNYSGKFSLTVAAFGLVFCTAKLVYATPLIGSNTGISTPGHVITFSEVALTEPTAIAANYYAYGATFDNLYYDLNYSGLFGHMSGPDARSWTTNQFNRPDIAIHFNAPVTAAAFSFLASWPVTSNFTSYLNGAVVETFSAIAPADFGNLNDYFGFTNSYFDQIVIQATPSNSQNASILDNVQFTSAPEPASIFLLGGSLLMILGVSRIKTSN